MKCFASGRPQDAVKGQSDLGPRIEKIQHLIGEYSLPPSLPPSLPVGTDRRVRRQKDLLAASSGRRAHRSCRPCRSVNVPPAALVVRCCNLAGRNESLFFALRSVRTTSRGAAWRGAAWSVTPPRICRDDQSERVHPRSESGPRGDPHSAPSRRRAPAEGGLLSARLDRRPEAAVVRARTRPTDGSPIKLADGRCGRLPTRRAWRPCP